MSIAAKQKLASIIRAAAIFVRKDEARTHLTCLRIEHHALRHTLRVISTNGHALFVAETDEIEDTGQDAVFYVPGEEVGAFASSLETSVPYMLPDAGEISFPKYDTVIPSSVKTTAPAAIDSRYLRMCADAFAIVTTGEEEEVPRMKDRPVGTTREGWKHTIETRRYNYDRAENPPLHVVPTGGELDPVMVTCPEACCSRMFVIVMPMRYDAPSHAFAETIKSGPKGRAA